MQPEELSQRIDAAIADVLKDYKDGEALLSRWLLVVEAINDDGRFCAYMSSEGMMSWEVLGLAEAASEYARAQLTYDYMSDVEPDTDD